MIVSSFRKRERLEYEFDIFRNRCGLPSLAGTPSILHQGIFCRLLQKDSGHPSMTWSESVDEALCFGWIDGIRKSVNEISYGIRFTPRKANSVWSNVNIRRVEALVEQGKMTTAGREAYQRRKENRIGIYFYEQRSADLPEPYASTLKNDDSAWQFFHSQPPSYRKAIIWWLISANQAETRLKRPERLRVYSLRGESLPEFVARKNPRPE